MELAGKKILLTGGTSGLGLELARLLLSGGAEVYAMGRNLNDPVSENKNFRFVKCDFSDLAQLAATVGGLINEGHKFDLVINNAGVLSPPEYTETKDGFEYSFQVNFLSHLLINDMIIKHGAYSGSMEIIAVTSPVYKHIKPSFRLPEKNNYRSFRVYSESKYYQLMLGEILKRDLPDAKFLFSGFNPGTFGSGIYRMQKRWFHFIYRIAAPFMRSPAKVAASLCQLAGSEKNVDNGVYSFNSLKPSFIEPYNEAAEQFMTRCLEIVRGIK